MQVTFYRVFSNFKIIDLNWTTRELGDRYPPQNGHVIWEASFRSLSLCLHSPLPKIIRLPRASADRSLTGASWTPSRRRATGKKMAKWGTLPRIASQIAELVVAGWFLASCPSSHFTVCSVLLSERETRYFVAVAMPLSPPATPLLHSVWPDQTDLMEFLGVVLNKKSFLSLCTLAEFSS